jgi:hypothetical protein
MKNREGFVSNSSSASFVVNKHYISGYQMDKIREHVVEAGDDAWDIEDKGDIIRLSTFMDNFNMHEYLLEIGVPKYAIQGDEW